MTPNDRYNDLNVTWTAIAGLIGAILTFAFIVVIQILFQRAERAQYQQKVIAVAPEQLSDLRSQQLARINSYRLVDEKKAVAAIPIDEAMQALVRDPAASTRAIEAAATAPSPGSGAGPTTQTAPATQPGGPRP